MNDEELYVPDNFLEEADAGSCQILPEKSKLPYQKEKIYERMKTSE
jgi:hypothetical protein